MNRFHRAASCVLIAASLVSAGAALPASAHGLSPLENATSNIQVPVLLRPTDRSRVDAVRGADHEMPSGEIFAAVFTGTAGPGIPTVEITATQSDRETSTFGLNTEYSYRVSAIFRLRGEAHVLNAVGTEHQHGRRNPEAHAQIACERATVDLAKQVQTLIVLGQRPDRSNPGEFRTHRRT